jgi:hypothetical protein
MKLQVNQMAMQLSGAFPGSTAYLAHYRPALASVVHGLTAAETDTMRALAVEWTDRGAPVEVQCRYVVLVLFYIVI